MTWTRWRAAGRSMLHVMHAAGLGRGCSVVERFAAHMLTRSDRDSMLVFNDEDGSCALHLQHFITCRRSCGSWRSVGGSPLCNAAQQHSSEFPGSRR